MDELTLVAPFHLNYFLTTAGEVTNVAHKCLAMALLIWCILTHVVLAFVAFSLAFQYVFRGWKIWVLLFSYPCCPYLTAYNFVQLVMLLLMLLTAIVINLESAANHIQVL